MIKRLLFFLVITLSINAQGQGLSPAPNSQYRGTLDFLGGVQVDSFFWLPVGPLSSWQYANTACRKIGAIRVNPADSLPYYMKDPTHWYRFLTTLDPVGTGTVRRVNSGFGLTGGPITDTGTLNVDSLVMASRNRLQKVADSLGAIIATKGSGTVKRVSSGFGLLGGAITDTGTLNVDSLVMASRLRLQKVADSLGAIIATKGTGSVTNFSFSIGPGFSYVLTTPTTTPSLAVTPTVNGMVKGNGSGFSAASGTDYVASVVALMPGVIFSPTVNFTTASNVATGTFSLLSQTAKTFFAAPSGSSGTPSFRAMTIADLPFTGTPTSSLAAFGDGTWADPLLKALSGFSASRGIVTPADNATTAISKLYANSIQIIDQQLTTRTLTGTTTETPMDTLTIAAGTLGGKDCLFLDFLIGRPGGGTSAGVWKIYITPDKTIASGTPIGTFSEATNVNGGTVHRHYQLKNSLTSFDLFNSASAITDNATATNQPSTVTGVNFANVYYIVITLTPGNAGDQLSIYHAILSFLKGQ